MNQPVTALTNSLKRPAYFLAAIGMLFTLLVTVLPAQAAQVQERAIRMSDNGVSGGSITSGVGSGTNVTYRVFFQAASSYTLKGVVVDFCDGATGTPFIGDTACGAPADFTMGGTPTVSVSDFVEGATTTTGLTTATPVAWSASSTNSGQTLHLTNTEGVALTSGTDYTFSISGVTNTSTLGTFYARLATYTSDTGDVVNYTHAAPGTYQDYGGFALSTAAVVQVSAKVQETLTFCVVGSSTQPPSAPTTPTDCNSPVSPAITLGHGTNNTLDTSQVDTNTVYSLVSTNALHGVNIRLRTGNPCGGLSVDGGTTCDIPAVNTGASTAGGITAGTAAFGMFCSEVAGGTGTVACDAGYNDGTNIASPRFYGLDTTTTGDNVTTTFGDTIATSAAPVNAKINQYEFAATASNTTPAGIYRANLAMIATGTF